MPGEELPKVTHYYREPYPYVRQKVAVIGAKNSAAKAALDCYRHGAEVTLIVRAPKLSDSVKYWIRPDLENRIKEGSIRAYFDTVGRARSARRRSCCETAEGAQEIENDWVLAMTGYRPDYSFLESLGLTFADDGFRTPVFDETTFETARSGVYIAGTVCGGLQTEPLVHRERPLSRPADREAHCGRANGTDPLRSDSLEDGGVRPLRCDWKW